MIAGQIEAVASRHRDPGRQDRHAGVVGDHRHDRRHLARHRAWPARCRWWSIRCARRCTATRCCTRARWIRFGPTVSARHAGDAQPRRGAPARRHRGRRRRQSSARRPGPCTRSARSGRWSRAGTCGRRRTAPTCCSTAPTSTSSTRTRIDTGNDHGAGDTLAAAVASALAHGYTVPDAVAFGKRWVTECLRAAYPLGHGHGPVSALFRLES